MYASYSASANALIGTEKSHKYWSSGWPVNTWTLSLQPPAERLQRQKILEDTPTDCRKNHHCQIQIPWSILFMHLCLPLSRWEIALDAKEIQVA